jgi:hypothetical protein
LAWRRNWLLYRYWDVPHDELARSIALLRNSCWRGYLLKHFFQSLHLRSRPFCLIHSCHFTRSWLLRV